MLSLKQKFSVLLVLGLLPWRLVFLAVPVSHPEAPATTKAKVNLVVRAQPSVGMPAITVASLGVSANMPPENCQLAQSVANESLVQTQGQINLNQPAGCFQFTGLAVVKQTTSRLAVIQAPRISVPVAVASQPGLRLAEYALSLPLPAGQQPAAAHPFFIDHNRQDTATRALAQSARATIQKTANNRQVYLGFNEILRC